MAQGTGFVNFQKMLGANRPYRQQVVDERSRESAHYGGVSDQFSDLKDNLLSVSPFGYMPEDPLAFSGDVKSLYDAKPDRERNEYQIFDSYGVGNIADNFYQGEMDTWNQQVADFEAQNNLHRPSSVDTQGISDLYRGIENFEQSSRPELYGSGTEDSRFNTDVTGVGTSGERALDSAIYGDVYENPSTTRSDFMAEDYAGQLGDLRTSSDAMRDYYSMLGLI